MRMSNKFKIIVLVLCLNACINKDVRNFTGIPTGNETINMQKENLIGKKIKAIGAIIGDSVNLSNKVVLLYDGFDCETCIDLGYEMSKRIDEKAGKRLVYVITTSLRIDRDQSKNSYKNYVFSDEHDIIRKELKYIYTPVLLKMDSLVKIIDVYFPNYQRDLNSELKFINNAVAS